MSDSTSRLINRYDNEFPAHEPELFNLYLKMPVQFKEDWYEFRKLCKKQGYEFEDVLGNLIMQFSKGMISFSKDLSFNEPERK